MRTFTCDACDQLVFFANDTCLRCDAALGLRPSTRRLEVLGEADRRCGAHATIGCNWLVEDDDPQCRSCRLTRTWPPLDDPDALAATVEVEAAKRRVVHQLLDLGLPVEDLTFDLLSSRHGPVTMGHLDGVVTIDVVESDDAWRVRERERLDEPYRTMLGHLRHESAHGLWHAMTGTGSRLERFRALFGDETTDYQAALDRHYGEGPPGDWPDRHVSAYASMHPMEDWAETVAHYLHIRDTLETAEAYGLRPAMPTVLERTPADLGGAFAPVLDAWLPMTYALNAVNRSMGKDDLYPFVLPPEVVRKLAYVHELVEG